MPTYPGYTAAEGYKSDAEYKKLYDRLNSDFYARSTPGVGQYNDTHGMAGGMTGFIKDPNRPGYSATDWSDLQDWRDQMYGTTGHSDTGVPSSVGPDGPKAKPSLTGLQASARPPVQQPAPTGNPTALPQIEGPGMMQSQGGSSATALSAAATTAIGGGATPAAQAAQAATPPSVAPPPVAPAPPAAPAPVQSAQKFRSKSSLAGLKRAGRRAY